MLLLRGVNHANDRATDESAETDKPTLFTQQLQQKPPTNAAVLEPPHCSSALLAQVSFHSCLATVMSAAFNCPVVVICSSMTAVARCESVRWKWSSSWAEFEK